MTIRGVLFDFSGTLFRFAVPAADPVGRAGGAAGDGAADGLLGFDDQVRLLRSFTAPAGRPAGLDPALHGDWDTRDLDPVRHRAVHEALLRSHGVAAEEAHRVYELLPAPESWSPYADAGAALHRLAAAGIPVGVLSNIAWDIRPTFARAHLDGLVRAFVLSFEAGRVKPDPELFRAACAALGTAPADTLMIGDSAAADGGAAAIGCPVVIVDSLPISDRPRALLDALNTHGLP